MKTKVLLLTAIAATLALLGCGQTSITETLDLVVEATDIAVSTLQDAGAIPAPTATLIENYLGQVLTAADEATAELESSDSPAVMASVIASDFAGVIAPDLKSGTVAEAIVSTVQAVASAIAKFLSNVQASAVLVARANGQPALRIELSAGDHKALPKIHARIVAVKGRLAKLSR